MVGTSSSPSLVNTLENCLSKIDAFSVSSNFIESLFLGSSSSGAIPHFVFKHRLVCVQNAFGFDLAFSAISRSSFRFAFRRRVFTLFRARAYWIRRFSFVGVSLFIPLIQAPCDRCFSFIAFLTFLSIGTLPLLFHVGFSLEIFGTNSSLSSKISSMIQRNS